MTTERMVTSPGVSTITSGENRAGGRAKSLRGAVWKLTSHEVDGKSAND